jgi:hypothetical protein
LVQKDFPIHEGFEDYLICDQSGKMATAWCPNKTWYSLETDNPPLEYCDIHSDGEIVLDICNVSGKKATEFCPLHEVETRSFITGMEPKENCDIHTKAEFND